MEKLKEYAQIISLSISFISLIIALYSVTIAKRSYKLNRQQFRNKLASFDFYLIDSYSIYLQDERLLLFHITVTNKSETKNSFSPTLFLEYYNDLSILTKIKLQHNPDLSKKIPHQTFDFFQKEIFLSDKESTSKWLIFVYNIDITKKKRIDSYILNLKDVNDNQLAVSTILMKELL